MVDSGPIPSTLTRLTGFRRDAVIYCEDKDVTFHA